MDRRRFLYATAGLLVSHSVAHSMPKIVIAGAPLDKMGKPDVDLNIGLASIDIGKGVSVKTLAYNGQVPGPMLRLKEGVPVSIDVTNAGTTPDIVHWHGLTIDSFNDGACEEGSPMIQPGETLRYRFTPGPTGTRWYHTHSSSCDNLEIGTYTGQFGFLLIDGSSEQGAYDREVNLAFHHWEPRFEPMANKMRMQSANLPLTSGSDVAYKYATVNAHMLGSGEPVRVKKGERILMRLLNASATENLNLSLPGHQFEIVAMDGNSVPHPRRVEVLSLAVAERMDALVEMNNPGIWVLGSTLATERAIGLGVVVEYAGSGGDPVWRDPAHATWDYSFFANASAAVEPDFTYELTFRDIGPVKDSKFDTWTINNKSWPDTDPIAVEQGKRYRLVLRNGSGDQHPMHLHRHRFEVTRINDKKLSGLLKDTVNIMPLDSVAVDFVADNPGNSLMHCHMQLHMDYGFMQMIKYKKQ